MKSDGTERPEPDPNGTDFDDEIEKILVREESKQHRTGLPLMIAKCILFLCMILFPASFMGSCLFAGWSYRNGGILSKPKDADQINLPQPDDAPKYERPVLDLVKPAMLETYGLKEFRVKCKRTGIYILIRTDETRGPRLGQAFGIMEDIRKMRRTKPELPACAWVLEIDHNAPDGGMTFVLPDAQRGYNAFPDWHDAALYTETPARAERARP